MKFSFLTLSCIACAPSKTLASNLRTKELSSRNLKLDETCTAVLVDTQYEQNDNDNVLETREHLSIECLTTNGMTYEVPSADTEFIQKNFIDGDFVSGETDIIFEAAMQKNSGTSQPVFKSPPVLIHKKNPVKEKSGKGRKLATTGDLTVLAIRVVISDGQTTANEDSVRDGIFGTGGDVVNLKTQYSKCSHNQLNFDSVGTIEGNALTINDGVITINLPNSKKSDGNSAIRNAINSVINTDFGKQPSQIADKVMYCLPSGTFSGIAFAGVGSWYSVYNDQWCGYSAVQMHEIGHNLRLAHAGDGTNEYGDQSGNMGYSYSEDDTSMCFNAAKSWQLEWYSASTLTIDASGDRVYEGELAGIIEDPFTVNVPILIKLNTPSSDDYYVNFNRKTGINSGTKEGGNQVMITKAGAEGNDYSQSWLQAKLSANSGNNSWESPADFSGETVTVMVNSIGTRANVKICVGTCPTVTDTPTASPSAAPVAATDAPIQSPTSSPIESPTSAPSASPSASPIVVTDAPIASPTTSPSTSPTDAPTSSPSASPSASPIADTDAPTVSPTASPSTSPTDAPTLSPSASPIAATDDPTASPTVSPSDAPTSSPSASPSASPIAATNAPTVSPTASPVAATNVPTSSPSASPSASPTKVPTTGSPCIEGTWDQFLQRRVSKYRVIRKNCKFLQKKKENGQLGNLCSMTDSQGTLKPAKDVCQVTCETCPSNCVELGSGKFFRSKNGRKAVIQKCEWLMNKSTKEIAAACAVESSPSKFGPAKDVCPVTCGTC